jgi:hypothetical protein
VRSAHADCLDPLGDALTVIAEYTCTDLTTAAERFRAAAYAGEIEVRARPGLFTDHRAGILVQRMGKPGGVPIPQLPGAK